MRTLEIPDALLRTAAVASIIAGVLMIAGFALHPASEDATFGTNPLWVPAHGLLWLAYAIALVGWSGLYLVQASRAGILGVIAFTVIIVGTSLASWIFSSDVTFVPVIAAEAPALFKKIYTGTHLAIGIASVLMWVLGNVLFGIVVIRAKTFARWAGVFLIVGTVIVPIAYLTGVPVRILAIGPFLAAVAQIRLGYELWMLRSTSP